MLLTQLQGGRHLHTEQLMIGCILPIHDGLEVVAPQLMSL